MKTKAKRGENPFCHIIKKAWQRYELFNGITNFSQFLFNPLNKIGYTPCFLHKYAETQVRKSAGFLREIERRMRHFEPSLSHFVPFRERAAPFTRTSAPDEQASFDIERERPPVFPDSISAKTSDFHLPKIRLSGRQETADDAICIERQCHLKSNVNAICIERHRRLIPNAIVICIECHRHLISNEVGI